MEIVLRFSIVIIALIICSTTTAFSALSSYEKMQCVFHSQNDDTDSCLMGYQRTNCGSLKCYRTVGQTCGHGNTKLNGNECASTLVCGCDKKCNGCMTVNGVEFCHFTNSCMPKQVLGKRSNHLIMPFDKQESYEFVMPEDSGMVNLSQI